ncbi:BaiN/RdsA family NAD(P)/FAD-dependent oxidoreductase [Myroides sp. LJL116]
MNYDVIIIGGGAAGFFTAINIAQSNADLKIAILERGKEFLTKVKISGGGRCNVTHGCFDPKELTQFYPRGEKELLGPFHQFCSGDTIAWFSDHGVELKMEEDGRMFPTTDSSQTIIDCFLRLAKKYKIDLISSCSVSSLYQKQDTWRLDTIKGTFECAKLVMTTGSNPKMWGLLQELGHTIIDPVPSLFTFNIKDKRIKDLMGIAQYANVQVKSTKLEAQGPVLITHWGMSGPGILRLSAWGARILEKKNYQFSILVNWQVDHDQDSMFEQLQALKKEHARKNVVKRCFLEMTNRLWESLVIASGIDSSLTWADLNNKQLHSLAKELTNGEYAVNGKSTFKEEFVTAGGVDLKQVNFKTMQSKVLDNMYFAGEIINIDAITGGFNFQNAWTTGFIAARDIVAKLDVTNE